MTTAPKGLQLNGFYDVNLKAKPGPGIAEAEQGPHSRSNFSCRPESSKEGMVAFAAAQICSGERVAGGVCF